MSILKIILIAIVSGFVIKPLSGFMFKSYKEWQTLNSYDSKVQNKKNSKLQNAEEISLTNVSRDNKNIYYNYVVNYYDTFDAKKAEQSLIRLVCTSNLTIDMNLYNIEYTYTYKNPNGHILLSKKVSKDDCRNNINHKDKKQTNAIIENVEYEKNIATISAPKSINQSEKPKCFSEILEPGKPPRKIYYKELRGKCVDN